MNTQFGHTYYECMFQMSEWNFHFMGYSLCLDVMVVVRTKNMEISHCQSQATSSNYFAISQTQTHYSEYGDIWLSIESSPCILNIKLIVDDMWLNYDSTYINLSSFSCFYCGLYSVVSNFINYIITFIRFHLNLIAALKSYILITNFSMSGKRVLPTFQSYFIW